jgi:hypothetical protein
MKGEPMLSPFAKLVIGAVTDFIITAGACVTGYMVAKEGVVMPTPAMWLLACLLGGIGAAKQVRGMLLDINKVGAVLLAAFLFGGCAGPFGITGSPEQLKELVKIKDAAATCVVGIYAGMTVRAVGASVDKGIYGGKIVMDENCKTTIETAPWVPGQPAPVVAPPKAP